MSLLKLGYSTRLVAKIMIQRNIRISKSTIAYWKKKLFVDKENINTSNTSHCSRGPKSAISPQQLCAIKKSLLSENPPSQRSLATKYGVHRRSIHRYIKKLNLCCRTKRLVHGLTEKSIKTRLYRSLWLSRYLAKNIKSIITSDEKLFHISDFNVSTKYFYRKSDETTRVLSRCRRSRLGKVLWCGRPFRG